MSSASSRVVSQDLIDTGTMGYLPHDHRNRNSHPPDACASTQDPWVESNPFESHLLDLRHPHLSAFIEPLA